MAEDVAEFIRGHNLSNTTLIGHSMCVRTWPFFTHLEERVLIGSRGAKTAMTLALRRPEIVADIVSVDNAPLDAALLSEFAKYVQGMKKVEEAGVTRQAEADAILKDYEEVGPYNAGANEVLTLTSNTRHSSYGNSYWVIYIGHQASSNTSSKFL